MRTEYKFSAVSHLVQSLVENNSSGNAARLLEYANSCLCFLIQGVQEKIVFYPPAIHCNQPIPRLHIAESNAKRFQPNVSEQ